MAGMSSRRQIRELALQALFELDARAGDRAVVAFSVERAPLPRDPADRADALALAERAWANRAEPDAIATELAPGWPTARQPGVDRALIRLAWEEMRTGRTPAKVAVNEAVELAKRYSTERSPAFINGVLDKMMKRLPTHPSPPTPEADPPNAPASDPWLADALAGRPAAPPNAGH